MTLRILLKLIQQRIQNCFDRCLGLILVCSDKILIKCFDIAGVVVRVRYDVDSEMLILVVPINLLWLLVSLLAPFPLLPVLIGLSDLLLFI